jgi:hypothetical protein
VFSNVALTVTSLLAHGNRNAVEQRGTPFDSAVQATACPKLATEPEGTSILGQTTTPEGVRFVPFEGWAR